MEIGQSDQGNCVKGKQLLLRWVLTKNWNPSWAKLHTFKAISLVSETMMFSKDTWNKRIGWKVQRAEGPIPAGPHSKHPASIKRYAVVVSTILSSRLVRIFCGSVLSVGLVGRPTKYHKGLKPGDWLDLELHSFLLRSFFQGQIRDLFDSP